MESENNTWPGREQVKMMMDKRIQGGSQIQDQGSWEVENQKK